MLERKYENENMVENFFSSLTLKNQIKKTSCRIRILDVLFSTSYATIGFFWGKVDNILPKYITY